MLLAWLQVHEFEGFGSDAGLAKVQSNGHPK